MEKFKALLSVTVILFVMFAVFAIYTSIRVTTNIIKTVFSEMFSREGVKKLTDNLFYGSILVLVLHFSEISTLTLTDVDLIIFIGLVLLIKPIEKIIMKS